MKMLSAEETNELTDLIFSAHRIDLRNYARSSLARRFFRIMSLNKLDSKEAFADFLINLKDSSQLIQEITVNTTEMFRDPEFWQALKEEVFPALCVHENFKIWHAGCSTGEEVISLRILLEEEGLAHRAQTFASDIDPLVLDKARKATYPLKHFELSEANYRKAGGKFSLDHYISEKNASHYTFGERLLENVSFGKFDLVKDTSYSKFDLILCRNVLIYFDSELQEKVISGFVSGLFSGGFIAIGKQETILSQLNLRDLNVMNAREKLYRYNK